jgi:hypothetical protein
MSLHTQLIALSASAPSNISTSISKVLEPLPRILQLTTILEFFQHIHDIRFDIAQALAAVWTYLIDNNLWIERFSNLMDFKHSIHFYHDILPLLKQAKTSSQRILSLRESIFSQWHVYPEEAIPDHIRPTKFSEHLLRELSILSRSLPLKAAQAQLCFRISQRLQLQKNKANRQSKLQSIDVILVHRNYRTIQTRKTRSSIIFLYVFADLETKTNAHQSENATVASNETNSSLTDESMSSDNESTYSKADGNFSDTSYQSSIRHFSPQVQKKSRCHCPPILLSMVKSISLQRTRESKYDVFLHMTKHDFSLLCRDHLKTFAGETLELLSNIPTKLLLSRLHFAVQYSGDIAQVHKLHPNWFRAIYRPPPPKELPLGFKYLFTTIPEPNIQPDILLCRYSKNVNAWKTWNETGNLLIPGFFDYLKPLLPYIRLEFQVYLYHRSKNPGDPALGFLRNMYYSLIQQLCRQDPAWYALQVAAPPDNAWRLISYPYITKAALPGDKTKFLHFDLDVDQYISDGIGGCMLSSSVSFLPESSKGSTVVVPGFHKKIFVWYKGYQHRQQSKPPLKQLRSSSVGRTTNVTPQLYPASDRKKFGKAIPVPCGQFGVRITLPTIIHGSTDVAYAPREVMFPWFTAIAHDHHTLEIPGQHTCEQVAECHRTLTPPSQDVNGRPVKFKAARFPASIKMLSTSSLCNALIGQQMWDDPQVQLERNIVLGSDPDLAWKYIAETREKLVQNYKTAFLQFERLERAMYGQESYFNTHSLNLS